MRQYLKVRAGEPLVATGARFWVVRPTALDHGPWSDLWSVGPSVGQDLANFSLGFWGEATGFVGSDPQTVAWPTDRRSGYRSTIRGNSRGF
uniref:Uncharacterized protein n=1 Tax=Solanum tuberosum TaxID=4113 RepID=M1DLY1_SOLTU